MSSRRPPKPYLVCADTRSGTKCTERPPGRGRSHYLPESCYFDADGFPEVQAARVTAVCVARWATHFRARPLVNPCAVREGLLPTDEIERSALLDDLFDHLGHEVAPWSTLIGLQLHRGDDNPVLDQFDGIPGLLTLTPRQFAILQDCWERERLPRDLYYPAREQRRAIEKVEDGGASVLVERVYSPLRWHYHNTQPPPDLR